jgi:hypothetical protein
MEPDNDGSCGAESDDGSDENVFDEPCWGCLNSGSLLADDESIIKAGSEDDSHADVADIVGVNVF